MRYTPCSTPNWSPDQLSARKTSFVNFMKNIRSTYQIYCDFSGYSDIALGSAQVMGYKLMVGAVVKDVNSRDKKKTVKISLYGSNNYYFIFARYWVLLPELPGIKNATDVMKIRYEFAKKYNIPLLSR